MHSIGWCLHLVCLVLFFFLCGAKEENFREIHARAVALFSEGNSEGLLQYLNVVEKQYKTLALVKGLPPSLYAYRGVVLYNAMRYEEAANDFKKAVIDNPTDTRSFINLGQVQVQRFLLREGIEAFEQAVTLGTTMDYVRVNCACMCVCVCVNIMLTTIPPTSSHMQRTHTYTYTQTHTYTYTCIHV